ncbi:hypothetical protein WJX84_005249 [Apatococcus fuscideae]|uniref:DOMON domain-containing protein n=1 Tax=Apatococcus fuscideae TaxID=2026836 RepID=A0AAW1T2W5_9CHLO
MPACRSAEGSSLFTRRTLAVLLFICQKSLPTKAHVQFLYPLAISPNDYLTSLHTKGLCGEERTGYDYSYTWRNWPFLNLNATELQAGTITNITWSSAVDHDGGWKLELYDEAFNLAYAWDNASHWGCDADGTARWAEIQLPKVDCNGCNGHGTCVQGSCQCDRSSSTGFWEGTHCEWESECGADADCGPYGQCVDMGDDISYPPRFQCYCRNGYFGTAGLTASGRLPVRTCTRPSQLTVNSTDARSWPNTYANQTLANPNQTYTVFWKIQNESATPYIEYAIWANTTNWVGHGLRPTANRSQTNSQPTYTDAFPWLLPGPLYTILNNDSSSGCPARPNGTPVDPETYDQGRLGTTAAPPDNSGWTAASPAPAGTRLSSWLADGQVNWRKDDPSEGYQQLYGPRPGFMLNGSSLNITEGYGQCQALETNFNDVAPMINQDIVVTTAFTSGYFRMLDYFTPNLARPRPDVVYGGTDDILDGAATEEAGVTYIKFRKPLFSNDSAGDYCLYPGINYQMVWAMGQTTPNISKVPPGSVNTNTASDRNFYKQDVLMYHGGGTSNYSDVTSPFRGTLGNVDLFAPPLSLTQTTKCAPSPIPGMECSATLIPGAYTLHWTPQQGGVNITAVAAGKGFVGLGWTADPGQMIGSHAIIGWVNDDSTKHVQVYQLNAKTPSGIVPANTFTPTSTLVGPSSLGSASAPMQMLQFFRPYDPTFQSGDAQNMIASYHDSHNYLDHHTNRQPFTLDFTTSSSSAFSSTVQAPASRLTKNAATAHGVCMWPLPSSSHLASLSPATSRT